MRLSVTAFNWLPSKAVFIGRQKEPGRPPVHHQYDNPFLAVVKFARFVGLTEIPAKTIEMLKTDPYYKYCFYKLLKAGSIYNTKSELWAADRERLKAILIDPASHNDKDVFFGLRDHMNNFPLYFPGEETRRSYEADPANCSYMYPVFRSIDRALGESGLITTSSLSRAAKDERMRGDEEYGQRAAHLKFCLGVFNALVDSGQFTYQQIWS